MLDIYQLSLDERFAMIMQMIARENGVDDNLNGLTVDQRMNAESLAEQAIINWAVANKKASSRLRPFTKLQHLLADYCALTEHL